MPQYPLEAFVGLNPSKVPVLLNTDANGNLIVGSSLPTGNNLGASSGNTANADAVAVLSGAAGKKTYLTGFSCTASGATSGLVVSVTVVGGAGGPLTYSFTYPAGVLVSAEPLNVIFNPPLPSSAVNTPFVITLPAGGSGNTHAAVNATGFLL